MKEIIAMDNSEKMFELADRLKALRDEKKEIEQSLKDINAELEEVDAVLAQLMTDTETQNFTRSGTVFCLTNTTRASAMADRKEDLFEVTSCRGLWRIDLRNRQRQQPIGFCQRTDI
jgi:chaperonin cofactor prefoldin